MKKDDTEQRLILAVLLSLSVYWVWMSLFGPAPQQGPIDTVTVGSAVETPATTSTSEGEATNTEATIGIDDSPAEPAIPTDIQAWDVEFETAELRSQIGRNGGAISDLGIKGYKGSLTVNPIWTHLWKKRSGEAGEWQPWGEEQGIETLISEEGLFLAAGAGSVFEPGTWEELSIPGAVAVKTTTAEGLEIRKVYRSDSENGLLDIEIRWENLGNSHFQDQVWLGAVDRFDGEANRYSNFSRPVIFTEDDLETLDDLEDVEVLPQDMDSSVGWFGIADRYFIAAAIPETPGWGRGLFAKFTDERHGAFMARDLSLEPGRSESLNLKVYIGSKNLDSLERVGQDLEKSVDFGIFGFFSYILLWILKFWQSLVTNWGLAIIFLTVSVKLAFWPLTRKSFESSRKMQRLAPQMADIKERHKDDAQKAGQAQMELFKKEGVNPLAGCLPMFIQMPVWFALYSVLLFAADLYQAEFLYLRDLTSKDPYGILPTLVGIGMVFQQRMTPLSPTMDPMQQKMIRFMPIAFTIIFYTFPSGLALYVLVNTVLSMVQMWMVNRAFPVIQQPIPAGDRSK